MNRRKAQGKTGRAPHAQMRAPRWSVGEVAEALGISTAKVRKLVLERQLPYYKLGARVVFDAADVEAFEQRCRVEAVR